MDWFLYDRDHRHERDNSCLVTENKAENKFNHIRKISRKTEGKFAEKGKFRERLFTSNLLKAWALYPTQTHHVYSTLKRRGNDHFHVVSTWNTRGVVVG